MDPYLEMDDWSDFHGALIFVFRAQLAPQLRPRYVVRAETRVYLERSWGEPAQMQPDVSIIKAAHRGRRGERRGATQAAVIEPELFDIPMPAEHREHYLVIRDCQGRNVVTVIELLSPANKRPGSNGYREYYAKREELLCRPVNLVEIDLLCAGRRPASIQPLASETDYCAFIHRVKLRPKAEVLQWTIRDRLPVVRIPLSNGDPDAEIDLQQAFETAYEGGEYDVTIDYHSRLKPPARRSDAGWIKQRVAGRGRARE
jgi:hypothetical protein